MSGNVNTVLRIDASARMEGSATREIADVVVKGLTADAAAAKVITRDVSTGLPFLDEHWVGANFTPAEARSDEQKAALELSDSLISELREADAIVIGVPVYNFGVPAALKAWVDLVARAGETFRYTENGPVGLLEGKKAYLVVGSGGTPAGSDWDYASTYMKHVLGFLGVSDVTVFAADQAAVLGEESTQKALTAVREAFSLAA
ncbi:MAG: NAD(P)H-dependent oxidoreductase [Rhodobacteraceae bacterium]|nr:NAD(P)H-dependent oxidoreductase [Paracoccaceae bacterium]